MIAYGRIDVYWPDGPIESYQLDKPTVAVGRSPGNDIVIDTTAVSRYHLSISYRDLQVFLEDLESVNGTYVDGERVKPHEPYLLRGGEEIQVGDIRLIFQPLHEQNDDISTRPIPKIPSLQETHRIEVVRTTFKIELDPPTDSVTPGAYIQANLNIYNVGPTVDHYKVEIEGIPKEWVRLDRSEIALDPQSDASILISFKPLRRSESAPGDYSVIVRVRAESAPNQPVEAPMTLTLRSFSGFGMVLGTIRVESGSPFELHMHNQGSGPLTLALSGATPGNALKFDIRPPKVTLAPGERKSIRGYIQPKRRTLVGPSHERRFDVLAHSQDASGFLAAMQGTFVEKSALPVWVPTLLIPIALILMIAAVLGGMAILNRSRTPVISAFNASATKVLEGDAVTLSWAVDDASSVALRVDNADPLPVDLKVQQRSQVLNQAGDHVLTLEARNGDQVVQKQITVTVVPALKINDFRITPNPVLRNVRQSVTLNWNVSGATSIRFVGLEALTGQPDNTSHPPSGELQLNGAPRDTVDLKLVAAASDNTQIDQSIHVDVKNPVCKVSVSNAEIRGGPGDVYPILRTIASNSEIMPDGRDSSAQWVHLAPSPEPQAWIAASAITCDGFSPDALTEITAIPPTPTPLPSATPTATYTPTPTETATPTVGTTKTASVTATAAIEMFSLRP